MGSFEETLSSVEGSLLPHLSFLLPLLEQVLLEPAIEVSPAFLAKLEAVAIFALVPPDYSTLGLVP